MINPAENQHMTTLDLESKVIAAFLGAALGDALGWPNEDRVRHAGGRSISDSSKSLFVSWIKRSGGRFMPYEEAIRLGEYSDDTQLILAISRSLLSAEQWWRDFAFVELPFWLTYERGGGSATKRAASSLIEGILPWNGAPKDLTRYFDAGGNGVAMRVLPHVVNRLQETDFSGTRWSIVVDGVCSHGHPRALVGALAYGYTLRTAFLWKGTLSYGALIGAALKGVHAWGALPSLEDAWPKWIHAADKCFHHKYQDLWDNTVREMTDLLTVCQNGITQAALAIDHQILEKLGCFDKRRNGAGTVAAAASIFLASRYAAAPMNGAIAAAHATGADTDTIASMTCSLLSAVAGPDWVYPAARHLQDESYLRQIASQLSVRSAPRNVARPEIRKVLVDEFIDRLNVATNGGLSMPDGRQVIRIESGCVVSKSSGVDARSWRITTNDEQVLYIKRIAKGNSKSRVVDRELPLRLPDKVQPDSLGATHIGIQLTVSNLRESKRFYEQILGLSIERETSTLINFGGVLALKSASTEQLGKSQERPCGSPVAIFIEVQDIDRARDHISRLTKRKIEIVRIVHGRRHFSCYDPDGHLMEFFAKNGE